MTSRLEPPALLENSSAVAQLDEKLLVLMKRLGIDAFPAHETLTVSLERVVVPGAELVRPSPRLVRSIKQVGVLQAPSLVLLQGAGLHDPQATFEVIFGRRRVLAARLAGRVVLKCEVYESGTPQLSSLLALIENEQRSAAWIKEIQDLRRLIDEKVGMTPDDLVAFGFDRGSLTERLKIAQLPWPLLAPILAGKMTQVTAKKLVRLTASQLRILEQAALSGQELTEELVQGTLRRQVNAGLAPLQAALEASRDWTVEQSAPPLGSGESASPGQDSPAVSLFSVLVTLRAFERTFAAGTSTQALRMLTRALIQEGEVVLRSNAAVVNTPREEVCHV